MKNCKNIIILVLFIASGSVQAGMIGDGFRGIWEGTKKVAQGTWSVVSSPFKAKKNVKKITKKSMRTTKRQKKK